MKDSEKKLREQLQKLSHEEKENVFVNYVKKQNGGEVPNSGGGCCPPNTCGVCVGGACIGC